MLLGMFCLMNPPHLHLLPNLPHLLQFHIYPMLSGWLTFFIFMLQINPPLGFYSSNTTPLLPVTPNPDIPSLSTAHTSSDHPSPDHPLPTILPNALVLLPASSNEPSPPLPPTLPIVTVAN